MHARATNNLIACGPVFFPKQWGCCPGNRVLLDAQAHITKPQVTSFSDVHIPEL